MTDNLLKHGRFQVRQQGYLQRWVQPSWRGEFVVWSVDKDRALKSFELS